MLYRLHFNAIVSLFRPNNRTLCRFLSIVISFKYIDQHSRWDYLVRIIVHYGKNLLYGGLWKSKSKSYVMQLFNFYQVLLLVHIHKQYQAMKLKDALRFGFKQYLSNFLMKKGIEGFLIDLQLLGYTQQKIILRILDFLVCLCKRNHLGKNAQLLQIRTHKLQFNTKLH